MQKRIPEKDKYWTSVMSALQQAWVPRGQGLPEWGSCRVPRFRSCRQIVDMASGDFVSKDVSLPCIN